MRRKPKQPEYKSDLATTYNNLAMATEDAAEGERLYLESLELRKQLVEQRRPTTGFGADRACSYQNVAMIHVGFGRWEAALKELEEGRILLQQAVLDQPSVTQYQSDLGQASQRVGHQSASEDGSKRRPMPSDKAERFFESSSARARMRSTGKCCSPPKMASRSSRRARRHRRRRGNGQETLRKVVEAQCNPGSPDEIPSLADRAHSKVTSACFHASS